MRFFPILVVSISATSFMSRIKGVFEPIRDVLEPTSVTFVKRLHQLYTIVPDDYSKLRLMTYFQAGKTDLVVPENMPDLKDYLWMTNTLLAQLLPEQKKLPPSVKPALLLMFAYRDSPDEVSKASIKKNWDKILTSFPKTMAALVDHLHRGCLITARNHVSCVLDTMIVPELVRSIDEHKDLPLADKTFSALLKVVTEIGTPTNGATFNTRKSDEALNAILSIGAGNRSRASSVATA